MRVHQSVFLTVIVALLVVATGIRETRATSYFSAPHKSSIKQLSQLGARVGIQRQTGKVNFIGFDRSRAATVPGMFASNTVEENTRAALTKYAPLFGVKDPSSDLVVSKVISSPDGRSAMRYQQLHQGIPVIGGELVVNINEQGQLMSISGEALPDAVVDTHASITASDARGKAIASAASFHNVPGNSLVATEPQLSIYSPGLIGPANLSPMLVWKTEVSSLSSEPINELVLVHAQRGHIALHFNQVHAVKNRRTFDGSAVLNPSQLPGTLLCNENDGDACTGGSDPDADAAHIHAGDTYDFYSVFHGRDSINGKGMALTSSVKFSLGCPNAFWYEPANQMIYCAGMPQGDDVVAHELTHGVTNRTSKLFYYYQSGAINESLSDIWGEFVDQTNSSGAPVEWILGEDTAVGVIRSLADPTIYGDPDRMTSANYYTASSDSGGVHHNSGINNKAAYLMVDGSIGETGGTFNGYTIAAMGIPKVAKIYYEVQTRLLTSGSDYLDLYNALYQGCLNLVGTDGITNADCINVREATLAVEMNQEPSAGFNPEASLCPAGQAPDNLFYDNFEGDLTKWAFSGPVGSTVGTWRIDATWTGPYATSGSHSLYAEDLYTLNERRASITNGVTIPAGGLRLHFNQAFGFSSPEDGGGRLMYNIDGGTFQDASGFFVAGQDYNGTISAGALSGASGFVNDSHGYVSSRYEVNSYIGQSIRFMWILGTGNSYSQGWWIDDVRLYTCVPNTAPTAPFLISPADTVTGIDSAMVEFSWDPSTDVDGDTINYNLEVCTDAGFTTCTIDITKGNAVAGFNAASLGGGFTLALLALLVGGRYRRIGAVVLIVVTGSMLASCGGGSSSGPPPSIVFSTTTLLPSTTYYWRVTADDGNGGLTPSQEWSFTTLP